MKKVGKLLVSLLVSFATAGLGSLATFPNLNTWYAGLHKPFFTPPNWVFGPVWGILYALIGISLYLIWTQKYKRSRMWAYIAFAIQLAFNAGWSFVFFGLHDLIGGVVFVLILWASILHTCVRFWPISRPAAYLLLPYVAWVTYASTLTIAVAWLNS